MTCGCCEGGVVGGASPPPTASENSESWTHSANQIAAGASNLTRGFQSVSSGSIPTPAIVQAGTFFRVVVVHATPVGAADLTYTLAVNGVATALTVTLNSGAAGPASASVDVPVVADDRITVTASNPGGIATVRASVNVGVRYS